MSSPISDKLTGHIHSDTRIFVDWVASMETSPNLNGLHLRHLTEHAIEHLIQLKQKKQLKILTQIIISVITEYDEMVNEYEKEKEKETTTAATEETCVDS